MWKIDSLRAEKGDKKHGSCALQKDNAHIKKCPPEELVVWWMTASCLHGFSLAPVVPEGEEPTGAVSTQLQGPQSARRL